MDDRYQREQDRESISGFSPWTIWSRMTPSGNGTPGPVIARIDGDSAETAAMTILTASKARGICLSGIKSDSTSTEHQSPESDAEKVATKRTGLVGLMLKGAGVK